MPKHSFLIEDILQNAAATVNLMKSGSNESHIEMTRLPKKRSYNKIESSESLNDENLFKLQRQMKPSPPILSPASYSSSASYASSTNSDDNNNCIFSDALQQTQNKFFESTDLEYLKQQYMKNLPATAALFFMNQPESYSPHPLNETGFGTDMNGLLLQALIQNMNSAQDLNLTNLFKQQQQQQQQQQWLNQYYSRLMYLNAANSSLDSSGPMSNERELTQQAAKRLKLASPVKPNNDNQRKSDNRNIYNLDEAKLKQPMSMIDLSSLTDTIGEQSAKLKYKKLIQQQPSADKTSQSSMSPLPLSSTPALKSAEKLHNERNSLSIENVSPLDALLQLANSTFVPNDTLTKLGQSSKRPEEESLKFNALSSNDTSFDSTNVSIKSSGTLNSTYNTNPSSLLSSSLKRKRKNRTAFTANQLYELEKRFSAQRYLSPHDRDRIAYELQLSTAQVITWFQNRRAKQKRDIEEMKNDVNAAKTLKVIDVDLDVDQVIQTDSIKQHFGLNGSQKEFESSQQDLAINTDDEEEEEDDREDDDNEEINVDDGQNDNSTNETKSGDASIQSPKSLS